MELKRKRCGVECGGLLIPRLLFTDDTSLFDEDVEGLEQSLMVLEEWCSRWEMKVNAEKSAIIHFSNGTVSFPSGILEQCKHIYVGVVD